MQTLPDSETLRAIHARMQAAAARLRLPFRSRTWRGQGGNWLGNIELIDCEIGTRSNQRVEADLLARYRSTCARHFLALVRTMP